MSRPNFYDAWHTRLAPAAEHFDRTLFAESPALTSAQCHEAMLSHSDRLMLAAMADAERVAWSDQIAREGLS